MDNITIKLYLEGLSIDELKNRLNLDFDPIIKDDEIVGYRAKLDNLLIIIKDSIIIIRNSLCKYYHGNNYTNFSSTQINQAVSFLSNYLGINLRDARVTRFEFGVVIIDNNIKETLSRLGIYKNKEPHIMHDHGMPYGIYYINTSHKIKIYSKSEETKRRYGIKLTQNLLRVEKEYTMAHIKSLAKFRGIKIDTLGDLCMRSNLQLLGEDLVESLSKIQIKNIPENIDNLTVKEIRRLGYFNDPYYRNLMKTLHFDAFKADRAASNKFNNEYHGNGQDQFIQEVRNKVLFCIEN